MGTEAILKALSTVQEPDLKKDLVTLQMVKDIQLKTRLGGVVLHLLSRLLPRKVCPTNLLYQGLVDRE